MNKTFKTLTVLILTVFMSCSQNKISVKKTKKHIEEVNTKVQSHDYGGWYCPDNLRNFPAVDINNWKNVPVINGRMPTKKESRNGTSLIFVDKELYPNAKPLDLKMPKLAKFYNQSSKKEETVIVIQAVNILNDSIVGFRYLNGGNGSARLNEIKLLSDDEIKNFTSSRFVSFNLKINSSKDKVWDVLTKAAYIGYLQPIYDKENTLKADWYKFSKVNYNYLNGNTITAEYSGNLFGNQYIQIDYEFNNYQYVEKFMLLEDKDTKTITLQIVCGPYTDDFESQKIILNKWAKKVKELSEEE